MAKVMLITKPGNPELIPLSYRPLCLLSTTGKLFESLITRRLQQARGKMDSQETSMVLDQKDPW